MNEEIINIAFTIDESYVQHFTIAVISLLVNNTENSLNIFLITDFINEELEEAADFILKIYKIKINILSIDSGLFNKYRYSLHFSKAVYFRLLLADILPGSIDKVLFMDSDIIVTGSIKELYNIPFNGNLVLAAEEGDEDNIRRLNELGIKTTSYFNAGIMVLNLKGFRNHNSTAGLLHTASIYMDKLLWWDQDILNIYFAGKRGIIPDTYNLRNIKATLPVIPHIIHYTGSSKPWEYMNIHPYKNQYRKYQKISPYKTLKYKDRNIINFLKKTFNFM